MRINLWVESWSRDKKVWELVGDKQGSVCDCSLESDDEEQEEEPPTCFRCGDTKYPPFYQQHHAWLAETLMGKNGHFPKKLRGLPPNVSKAANAVASTKTAIHHNHLTMEEFLSFPWDGEFSTAQWVQLRGFLETLAHGRPYDFSPMVDPRRYREVSYKDMLRIAHGLYDLPPEYTAVTRVNFYRKTKEVIPEEMPRILTCFEDMASSHPDGTAGLRVLFWGSP